MQKYADRSRDAYKPLPFDKVVKRLLDSPPAPVETKKAPTKRARKK